MALACIATGTATAGASSAVGKDAAAGKATFVSLLGVERARTQARMLAQQASAYLDPFGEKADIMRAAAVFVISRDR